jgi:gamma-glutamylcyclotransferase (GGCT)/AIG2-like uncharacterized protein YtfP
MKWWRLSDVSAPFVIACDKREAFAQGSAMTVIDNSMNSDRLFVYGTLMRGFDHPMAKLLSRSADFIGEARCRGRLYLVKHYPGLVLSDDPSDFVFGELYRLCAPQELLREFDMYEACGEGFAQPTEYIRRMLSVTRDGGAASEAWTYVYNWPVDRLPRIVSGRFLEG